MIIEGLRTELPEPHAVTTLDTLDSIHLELDDMLEKDLITRAEYDAEWADALQAIGWTDQKYSDEVDRRWDYVDSMRAVPPVVRYRN